MSKDKARQENKGNAAVLSVMPEKLVNLLITNSKARKRAIARLENNNDKHKGLLTTLLLQRLYTLTQAIEKNTGAPFVLQQGFALINKKKEDRFLFPMPVPIRIDPGLDYKKAAKAVLNLSKHDALAFTMCLQVVEWAIKTTENTHVKTAPALVHSEL